MILAIDDDPDRYDGLRRWLDRRIGSPALVVASCSVCVLREIPNASAVLLDYDLDGHEDCEGWRPRLCPTCRENLPDRAKGIEYVPEVAASGLPVLVVSSSYRENVDRMVSKLHGYGVRRLARHSATETMPEPVWIAPLGVGCARFPLDTPRPDPLSLPCRRGVRASGERPPHLTADDRRSPAPPGVSHHPRGLGGV